MWVWGWRVVGYGLGGWEEWSGGVKGGGVGLLLGLDWLEGRRFGRAVVARRLGSGWLAVGAHVCMTDVGSEISHDVEGRQAVARY